MLVQHRKGHDVHGGVPGKWGSEHAALGLNSGDSLVDTTACARDEPVDKQAKAT